MPKAQHIPTRTIADGSRPALLVGKVSDAEYRAAGELHQAHRHDHHFFVLQLKGTARMEVDLHTVVTEAPSIMYQAPEQVHRALGMEDLELYVLLIVEELLAPDLRKALKSIAPVAPLPIAATDLALLENAFALCLLFFERRSDKHYLTQLKNSANALIALFLSLYAHGAPRTEIPERHGRVATQFRDLLETHYHSLKRPADYAAKLHISVPYLNECVKRASGISVSQHIHQRVVLEAKRMLHHTAGSVQEIAAELGYDDPAYFTRLFTRVAGMSPSRFRRENRD